MQLVEQRFTQHTRVVLTPHAQIYYLPKTQAQASPAPRRAARQARRPTPEQADSTVTAEETPPPAAPSLLTVSSAYAVPVPPGHRRAAGPRAPRLYRHGGRRLSRGQARALFLPCAISQKRCRERQHKQAPSPGPAVPGPPPVTRASPACPARAHRISPRPQLPHDPVEMRLDPVATRPWRRYLLDSRSRLPPLPRPPPSARQGPRPHERCRRGGAGGRLRGPARQH